MSVAIEKLRDRFEQADAERRAEAERLDRESWDVIRRVARESIAGAEPSKSDIDKLVEATKVLNLNADDVGKLFSTVEQIVRFETEQLVPKDSPLAYVGIDRSHCVLQLDLLRRSHAGLFDGIPVEPLSMELPAVAQEMLQRQHSYHHPERPPSWTDQKAAKESALDEIVQVAREAASNPKADVSRLSRTLIDEARRGGIEHPYELRDLFVSVAMVCRLEAAADRDESIPGSWADGVRPSLAANWLSHLHATRPELFGSLVTT